MKKMLKTLMILSALLFFSPQAALAHSYAEGVGDKLAHGIANTVTGIGEIPKNIMLNTKEKGAAYGVPVGLFTGIVHGIGRTLTGAVDLITFIIPTKPIIYPDFIWKDWDKETHYHPDWKLSTDSDGKSGGSSGGSYQESPPDRSYQDRPMDRPYQDRPVDRTYE
jgi:putative exosortase-associated protein (TIGR04073 family)